MIYIIKIIKEEPVTVTRKEKEDLFKASKQGITLNGQPAKLINIKQKVPTIKSGDIEHNINWKSIKDVIENLNGDFTS